MDIKVKIINNSPYPLPEYATKGSSGLDLKACINEPITLDSLDRRLIPTGLFIQLPIGYEAQVRPRSGIALRNGITCINSPGTIDSDYRGEIGIELINLSRTSYTIYPGDRVAQLVISKYEKVEFELTEKLDETERGIGGYGHTGIN